MFLQPASISALTANQGAAGVQPWPVTDAAAEASLVTIAANTTGAALDTSLQTILLALQNGSLRGTIDRSWLLDAEIDSVNVGDPTVHQAEPWDVFVKNLPVVQPVDGSAVVQPVSVATLPLPVGAAADATNQGILSAVNEIAWQEILRAEEGGLFA